MMEVILKGGPADGRVFTVTGYNFPRSIRIPADREAVMATIDAPPASVRPPDPPLEYHDTFSLDLDGQRIYAFAGQVAPAPAPEASTRHKPTGLATLLDDAGRREAQRMGLEGDEPFVARLRRYLVLEGGKTEAEAEALVKRHPTIVARAILRGGPFVLEATAMALEMAEEPEPKSDHPPETESEIKHVQ